ELRAARDRLWRLSLPGLPPGRQRRRHRPGLPPVATSPCRPPGPSQPTWRGDVSGVPGLSAPLNRESPREGNGPAAPLSAASRVTRYAARRKVRLRFICLVGSNCQGTSWQKTTLAFSACASTPLPTARSTAAEVMDRVVHFPRPVAECVGVEWEFRIGLVRA